MSERTPEELAVIVGYGLPPTWWLEPRSVVVDSVVAALREAGVLTPPLQADRDSLGRRVREVWVLWAQRQPSPKPSWLVPYDELAEADKEADRCIGSALWGDGFAAGMRMTDQLAHFGAGVLTPTDVPLNIWESAFSIMQEAEPFRFGKREYDLRWDQVYELAAVIEEWARGEVR